MINFNEYAQLVDVLNKWAEEYAAGHSSVTDDVYDKNYLLLKEFEAANPFFILDTSPTRRVIDGATGFRKVKHEIPMISIANSNGIDEAVAWVADTLTRVPEVEIEYKLDGLGLALIYRGGQLVDSVTRGVDNVGDSVWENALRIGNIPHTIPLTGEIEIRGEVVWKYDEFNTYNEYLAENGKKTLSNPRNGAAGVLKSHDPSKVEQCKLSFIAYLIVRGSESDLQSEDIETLKRLGFEVPPSFVVSTVDEFRRYAEELRMARYEQEYAIDGEVIKVNDKRLQPGFGYTAKTPNFYRAYKFPPEEKETELLDIEQSVGMSGAITPVAIVKPVSLAMTTVQRCSLHNWDLVEYLGLHKGCHVVIRKAGEIIPEIVMCTETGRSKDRFEVLRSKGTVERFTDTEPIMAGMELYDRPEKCPFCGYTLRNAVNESGEKLVAWVCGNMECRSQIVGKLANFASRTAMNIRGIGESVAEALVESGKVKDFDDLYKLDPEDLVGLCGYKTKSAEKLVSAINASRSNYLSQLIEGFSIPGVGHQASPILAGIIGDLGGLGVVAQSEYLQAELSARATAAGITGAVAAKFAEWLRCNEYMCQYFADNGIAQAIKESAVTSTRLAGKVCIMTGTFDALERDRFKELVVANGGTICSGITKKTNLVLLGDSAGPKKVQAINDLKKAGVPIDVYTPDTLPEFMKLVE